MARGAELPAPRVGAGARRQPPAGSHRPLGDAQHVGARAAGPAGGAAVAAADRRHRDELLRAAARPGAADRLRRAVGGADARHAATGPAREGPAEGAACDRRAGGRAHGRGIRRRRLRLVPDRDHPRHTRVDLRRRRTQRAAERRLLQHPAAGRRQRRRPRLDALRLDLGRVGQRRHGRGDGHRHPARHREHAVLAWPDAGALPRRAHGPQQHQLRLGQRHQPARHRGRGLRRRRRALPRGPGERLDAGDRGDQGRGRGAARHRDSLLRADRHARLRRARGRPRRGHDQRHRATADGRADVPDAAGRRMGDRVDRGRRAAHERRHRPVVRPLALHDQRLGPDAAPARAAGGDPPADEPRERPRPVPGCRGRRERRDQDRPAAVDAAVLRRSRREVARAADADHRAHAAGVDPERPDVAYIQELVRAALHPPVPEEEK